MTIVHVAAEDIDTFATDGVVCLRGVIPQQWIDRLLDGVEHTLAEPTPRGRLWNRDEEGRESRYDSQVWRTRPEYADFVFESPLGEIAGRLMQSSRVNFFFDAMFARAPGTQFRTPFHQDEPVWSVAGFQTVSSWMPLVPVGRASALEVVQGSHLWEQNFRQPNFGALTGDERDNVAFDDGTVPLPEIERHRDEYEILSWDMEPGDVMCFNGRAVHGGSGNLPHDRELKVFNTKWLGDDVRVRFRKCGMDPDHSEVMTDVGLKPGDRLGTDLYPEVWSSPRSER
jgi:ectoine hydroxylase-related dioxygenase (phytanoyl-CoA dioxygenase family)